MDPENEGARTAGISGSPMNTFPRKPEDLPIESQDTGPTVVDQAKDTAGQVVGQAQQKTGQLMDAVKQQASARLSGQVDRTSEGLTGIAQAMSAVGRQLREQNQQLLAGYADQAAGQAKQAAGYLQGKDVEQLLTEAERFARQKPLVFVGGAFTLGLLAARFLRSSASGPQSSQPRTTATLSGAATGYSPSPDMGTPLAGGSAGAGFPG